MENIIENFSVESIKNYFWNKLSDFKQEEEDFSEILKENEAFSDLEKLGEVELSDGKDILFFACKSEKDLSERSGKKIQYDIAKRLMQQEMKDSAIAIFYDDKGDFRFSFIRRNYGGDEKFSSWKRYSYFVSKNQTNKTFLDRIKNADFSSLKKIQEAFSVEKLTKDFYDDLFKWFSWTLTEEVGVTFPNDTRTSNDDKEKLEEKIIRLITRVLFVWFIKHKGLVPDELFNIEKLKTLLKNFDEKSTENGNYYNAILQNLFFATLNKPVKERGFATLKSGRDIKTLYRYAEMFSISEEEVLKLFEKIPFLNGGLFECLDKELSTDGVKYHLDGFSRNASKSANGNFSHRAFIPNCVFFGDAEKEGLIPLLSRYNFTIEENSSQETQVALDPELLGNVFENLLGAFNEETRESARKESGSFYTPREIVDFMVDESLKSYLNTDIITDEQQFVEILFKNEDLSNEEQKILENKTLCKKISEKLHQIKIIDPACGSGAFPMGVLSRMVELLDKLDIENQKSHYDLKLHLIEECIYGVDIQSIAAQISKLRFFISLIVEQEKMDFSKENYGVHTLPNLETKFVTANTLINARKQKESFSSLFDSAISNIKESLVETRKAHFYAKNSHQKKLLREKDEALREELAQKLQEFGQANSDDAKNFAEWNPYDQNASSPFFDMEWMFGVEDGFDIVIGNPPYIQLQKDGGKLAKMYENQGYQTFARTGDIYSLFYEKGYQILKPKGILAYITSNKWMRAGYGEATRSFFAEKTNPLQLIDFAGIKVFESATVDTNILIFAKENNTFSTRACVVKDKELKKLSDYIKQNGVEGCRFDSSESWVILSEIEQKIKAKIEAVGTPLKDWDINIYRGILTGYNEAFIIDKVKKEEILANCQTDEERQKTAEIIRPILRGRDIKRYGYKFADLYLLFIPWHFPLHLAKPEIKGASLEAEKAFENQYPAIYNHLLQYKKELSNRNKAETGIRYEWYALQRWGANYWEDFYKQKIVYQELTQGSCFYLDKEAKFFVSNTGYLITGNDLEYLILFLNSKFVEFIFKSFYSVSLGGLGIRWLAQCIENLPIPFVKDSDYKKLKTEEEIEKYIYTKYDLSEEEINYINSL
jgi:putative type IIS restriction endonuclease